MLIAITPLSHAQLVVLEWQCKEFRELAEFGVIKYGAVGIIQNIGNRKYSFISIKISLISDDEIKVGDAITFISGLNAGQKSKFKAEGMAQGIVRKCDSPELHGF